MYYGEIKDCDIANGAGVRITIFVSGCRNHCKDCFQPQTWAFDYGQEFTKETEDCILGLLKPSYIKGLTLLGGDPFEPENQRALLPLLHRIKDELPGKNIWAFSGYTYEVLTGKAVQGSLPVLGEADSAALKGANPGGVHSGGPDPRCEVTDEMLSLVDVLVDGPFVQELKDITLRFRGSRNQRLIDMNETRAQGSIVQLPDRVSTARRGISTH